MEFIENIKKPCKENGISLHALEMLLFMTKDMSKSDLQKVTAIAQVMKDNENV